MRQNEKECTLSKLFSPWPNLILLLWPIVFPGKYLLLRPLKKRETKQALFASRKAHNLWNKIQTTTRPLYKVGCQIEAQATRCDQNYSCPHCPNAKSSVLKEKQLGEQTAYSGCLPSKMQRQLFKKYSLDMPTVFLRSFNSQGISLWHALTVNAISLIKNPTEF